MENQGKYIFEDNSTKIKVTTSYGQQSVLFEDIASIGYSRMFRLIYPHHSKAYVFIIGGGVLGLICLFINGIPSGGALGIVGLLVMLIGCIVGVILWLKSETIYWDTISIETKGGKIIPFDVPDGTAKKEVELIENKKRDITGVK